MESRADDFSHPLSVSPPSAAVGADSTAAPIPLGAGREIPRHPLLRWPRRSPRRYPERRHSVWPTRRRPEAFLVCRRGHTIPKTATFVLPFALTYSLRRRSCSVMGVLV